MTTTLMTQADAVTSLTADGRTVRVGDRVRVLTPRKRQPQVWGQGVVTRIDAANLTCPLEVRRADGATGYYRVDRVEVVN
jgi:hypothetical protein